MRSLLLACAPLFLLSTPCRGQGEFVNFESPQVRPITVAEVGGHEWLLVCNTPDNSVEIYDASSPYHFIRRVPVGLEPVTVRWNADLGRFYTCNFVGDSVTAVELLADGNSVRARVERTNFVGDEPCDIVFTADNLTAFVTLNSRSSFTQLAVADLSVAAFQVPLVVPGPLDFAVKQPRAAESLSGNRILIANFMGDRFKNAIQSYDLDFYVFDPAASSTVAQITDLGTTNHSFAVQSNGSRMFVVGTRAQHLEGVGGQATSQLATGFVQSWMWVVDIPAGQASSVVPEATPNQKPATLFQSINLNRDYEQPTLTELSPDLGAAQPTGIQLLENEDGAISKIFVTAYHSDKVLILEPDANIFGGWRIQRLSLHAPAGNYTVVGPRDFALSAHATDPQAGRPGLVYSLNRLDNTVSVFDPDAETELTHFSLRRDPTPALIRKGRQFLYSTQFSGNGMVSCASCHIDGRTDGLPWNLGNLDPSQPAIAPWLNDGNDLTLTNFPTDKGPMVTQTLQGLVNAPVNPTMQPLFTNAPYHWRGDKSTLNEFNEAFVNLQGMPNGHGTGLDPKGISDRDMQAYANYINTIVHPPNPEQPLDRRQTGNLNPDDPNNPDPTKASGDKLGMMLFHNQPSVSTTSGGVRSCVQCHNLPDGSGNTFSLAFTIPGTLQGTSQVHPIESAATRNLFQREMLLHSDFTQVPVAFTGNFGLLHPGDFNFLTSFSINTFVTGTFGSIMPGPSQSERTAQIEAVVGFMRRFDSGIAPAAGFAYTLSPTNSATNGIVFDFMQEQVKEANIGLSAYTRRTLGSRDIEKGYYYDLTLSPPAYQHTSSAQTLSRAQLEAFAAMNDAVVILQGTPIGSERRIAHPQLSSPLPLPGPPPANIRLEPMAPATQWLEITKFTGNINLATEFSLRTRDEFWKAITQDGQVSQFGLPATRRHEPPRRFRVTGDNIRPGAKLFLGLSSGAPQTNPQYIIMDLFPTQHLTGDGDPIWETTVELAPTLSLAFLNGGIWAPAVVATLFGDFSSVGSLDPTGWNFFTASVLNADSTFNAAATWQPLTFQDDR